MATSGGPNIVRDGLQFGYDTGYPAADNTQALRFNNGEPTTNLVTNPDFSTGDMTGWSSTDTSNSQVDIREVAFENGYYYFHKKCTSTGAGSHDRLYQSSTYTLDTSLTTTVTIDIWINPQNAYSISFYGLGSTADDTTYNEKPLSSNSSEVTTIDLGGGWARYIYTLQTAWYTGSGTSFRVAVYPGWSGTGLMEYKVKSLQVEQKGHATPFVNGTRSSTQSLIDLKESTNINVSNLTFDSTGQPEFNGTDDYIDLGSDVSISPINQGWTAEYVFNSDDASVLQHFNGAEEDTHNANWLALYQSYLQVWDHGQGVWKRGSTVFSDNTWYHIAFVQESGTSMQFYVNGVAEGGNHTSFSWTASRSALNCRYVGRYEHGGSYSRYWNGHIAVVRLYNKPLSASEVKQNYKAYKKRFGI